MSVRDDQLNERRYQWSMPQAESTASAVDPTLKPAFQRFQTCRWRRPAENGAPEGCTHRDVRPFTGARGFDPEAWCTDCRFYKLRRTPKKRPDDHESYY